jgi:hypothetical protein
MPAIDWSVLGLHIPEMEDSRDPKYLSSHPAFWTSVGELFCKGTRGLSNSRRMQHYAGNVLGALTGLQ